MNSKKEHYNPNEPDDHPLNLASPGKRADPGADEAARLYSYRAPGSFTDRIDWSNPDDPLLRQVMPSGEELQRVVGFTTDPLQEAECVPVPGLIQKYPGRVLLRVTRDCAIHCRYCFRRHDKNRGGEELAEDWAASLRHIRQDWQIREVILSGGDPLMVSDQRLAGLAGKLAAIPHLTRLRIHSRMPVASPERVGDKLLGWLNGTRLTPMMVIHCNHPAELSKEVVAALGRLAEGGVPLFNQSVLLKGVNDRVDILAELSERLLDARCTPYYLHLLDPVAGAAHFQVGENRAKKLTADLRLKLPGLGVPTLVREIPGEGAKTVL
ncbi:MAG: EF-P beta-lysylation protein EpmB [Magnetococcales bacterium]|nr:EF-P beta-lysylation protein EpmB [Magnetococcales bacterium]